MSFTFKDALSLSIFGSSHGPSVGFTLSGVPAGIKINPEEINLWMSRRAPGQSILTTQRKETDEVELISGINEEFTDGGAITGIIKNLDVISKTYSELRDRPRPGHGDISLYYKYGRFRNYQGGGFLSGRMTACLVAAGSIVLSTLKTSGIDILSYIDSMGDISLGVEGNITEMDIYSRETRMPDSEANNRASSLIMDLIKSGDSTGASIKTVIKNCPPGLGEPFFDSFESVISHLMFSIPGLKGIEFGSGFGFTRLKGTQSRDEFYMEHGKIRTRENHNGGILGGITNGMPVEFRVAMKPTSSIRDTQNTVNLETMENDQINVKGRHDPCIAIRAVPVITSVSAIAVYDLILRSGTGKI